MTVEMPSMSISFIIFTAKFVLNVEGNPGRAMSATSLPIPYFIKSF
jgi:hypothetical protein